MRLPLPTYLFAGLLPCHAAAQPIELVLTAEPSKCLYEPGEVVHITASLKSLGAADITNIGLIQFVYNYGPFAPVVEVNSDAPTDSPLANALSLLVNPANNPVYAAITPVVPSAAVIPLNGDSLVTFDAVVPPSGPAVVDVRGYCYGEPLDAFITTDTFSVTWRTCAFGGYEPLLGGTLTLPTADWSYVNLSWANPPRRFPHGSAIPFRDVLQTGTGGDLTQGIGAAGTPAEDTIQYEVITLKFDGVLCASPTVEDVTVTCTGTSTIPCPGVISITGASDGPHTMTLSGPIPPGTCATFDFAFVNPGELKLKYQSLPGDVNYSGAVGPADATAFVTALNNGQATMPANRPRYDINRNGAVTTADALRLVGLLNGINTTQPWSGANVANCP